MSSASDHCASSAQVELKGAACFEIREVISTGPPRTRGSERVLDRRSTADPPVGQQPGSPGRRRRRQHARRRRGGRRGVRGQRREAGLGAQDLRDLFYGCNGSTARTAAGPAARGRAGADRYWAESSGLARRARPAIDSWVVKLPCLRLREAGEALLRAAVPIGDHRRRVLRDPRDPRAREVTTATPGRSDQGPLPVSRLHGCDRGRPVQSVLQGRPGPGGLRFRN